jgi:hypothetical protein
MTAVATGVCIVGAGVLVTGAGAGVLVVHPATRIRNTRAATVKRGAGNLFMANPKRALFFMIINADLGRAGIYTCGTI